MQKTLRLELNRPVLRQRQLFLSQQFQHFRSTDTHQMHLQPTLFVELCLCELRLGLQQCPELRRNNNTRLLQLFLYFRLLFFVIRVPIELYSNLLHPWIKIS